MPILRIAFLLLLFLNSLQAQDNKIDSLQKIVSGLNTKSADFKKEQVRLLQEILEINLQAEEVKDSLFQQIDFLAALYKELGDQERFMELSFQKKGLAHQKKEELVEAIRYYRKYAEYLKSKEIKDLNGYFFIDMGNIYLNLQLFKNATIYYEKAVTIFKAKNEEDGLSTAYSCLVLTAREAKDIEGRTTYARLAFELRKKKEKDPCALAYQHYVLGTELRKIEASADEARLHLLTARQILMDSAIKKEATYAQLSWVLPVATFELGRLAILEKKLDSVQYYRKELKKELAQGAFPAFTSLFPIALDINILYLQNKLEEAKLLNEKAIKEYAPQMPGSALIIGLYEQMVELSSTTGDSLRLYKYAYQLQKMREAQNTKGDKDKLLEINSILLEMENEQTIQAQELDLKIKANDLQKERQLSQRLVFGLLAISLCLIFMGLLWWIVRRKNQIIQAYTKELEASNQTKALMLSVIGHDLRSPFNSIFNNIQFAQQEENTVETKNRLNQIAKSSQSAFIMLDALMQWVSLQKDNLDTSDKWVKLAPLLETILAPLEQMVVANQLIIEEQLELESVKSDQGMLQIMLRNLLLNAIKYSPVAGKISIKSYWMGTRIAISISNEGGHIPESQLSEILDARAVASKGTGLGLHLVKDLAKKTGIAFKIENCIEGGVICYLIFEEQPKFNSVFLPIETVEPETTKLVVLSSEEKDQIQSLINAIQGLAIYESSDIRLLMSQTELNELPNTQDWKKQVLRAVQEMDETAFSELTNLENYV